MNRDEYVTAQAQLIALASLAAGLPLQEFVKAGERSLLVGWFLDPTLYREGGPALERIVKLARAAREFQAAAIEFNALSKATR